MANVYKGLVARAICASLAMAWAVAAYAQEKSESNLDVTIRLLPENAVGPEDITRRIELPPAAARPTPPGAEPDDTAQPPADDKEKEKGRADEAADEARERGREFGQETAEQARGNRENAGRPDDAPGRGPPSEPGPRWPPDTPPGRR
jgi:RNA processing factor Prp31